MRAEEEIAAGEEEAEEGEEEEGEEEQEVGTCWISGRLLCWYIADFLW